MIFLILAIFSSVILFFLFKEFEKQKINTHNAITFNYLIACIMGFLLHPTKNELNSILYADWLIPTIILGLLFIIMFNIMAITTQKLGVSIASTAAKMSLIIPVLIAYFINTNTPLSNLKISGIIIGLISVYFTFKKETKVNKSIIFAVVLFIGSGLTDATIDYIRNIYLNEVSEFTLFIITIFFVAFILGLINIFFNKQKINFKDIKAGLILGVPNYFSIYFVLKSLEILGSITVFPVLNIGIVLISSTISWLFYKEKISKINWIGIFLACISILLIIWF